MLQKLTTTPKIWISCLDKIQILTWLIFSKYNATWSNLIKAVALNRTLIIPPWFKHDRGDPTSNGSTAVPVDFYQRKKGFKNENEIFS